MTGVGKHLVVVRWGNATHIHQFYENLRFSYESINFQQNLHPDLHMYTGYLHGVISLQSHRRK
jgi:hypothetical protein